MPATEVVVTVCVHFGGPPRVINVRSGAAVMDSDNASSAAAAAREMRMRALARDVSVATQKPPSLHNAPSPSSTTLTSSGATRSRSGFSASARFTVRMKTGVPPWSSHEGDSSTRVPWMFAAITLWFW